MHIYNVITRLISCLPLCESRALLVVLSAALTKAVETSGCGFAISTVKNNSSLIISGLVKRSLCAVELASLVYLIDFNSRNDTLLLKNLSEKSSIRGLLIQSLLVQNDTRNVMLPIYFSKIRYH